MIVTIIGVSLLAIWGLTCIRLFYKRARAKVIASGFVFRVRCEHCGTEYDVPVEEFLKSNAMKSRSKARTKLHGAVCDNSPVYSYAAKRFSCPGCQGKCWAQILNYNEYQKENRVAIIGYALLMAFGFYLGANILAAVMRLVERIAG
ncbi:MAG: hypothetical protein J6K53_00660 [Roseburia sp.]|nr:hypothetical protein [Roseburia sp.]